jgi:serine/threonine protein kinase
VEDEIKFPEYIDVTDEAKDFILKICKKNPEERMEMREILRHPFITKYLKDRKVGNEVVEEFRKVLG